MLVDFGSTFTKVAVADETDGRLLARAQAPTSVSTDLVEGYHAALDKARQEVDTADIGTCIAASSAGGGLRIAAIGLVSDLTAAAARQAALNAGGRVGSVIAGRIGSAERSKLEAEQPEIVLFAGGTDGGEREEVLEMACGLSDCAIDSFVVVACNSAAAEEAAQIFATRGLRAEIAANVMPELGRIEISEAREAILRAFIEHVIGGKNLSASSEFKEVVKMPTPDAVLRATQLLSEGVPALPGVGDVLVVDIGGATTDVHSDRRFVPSTPGIEEPLLPPPLALRTVEGDLGLRAGAPGVVEADAKWIGEQLGSPSHEELATAGEERAGRPSWIPNQPSEVDFDRLLAIACTTHALNRHCGTMVLRRDQNGPPTLARTGPDLREVNQVVGTGGVLAHYDGAEEVLRRGLKRRAPRSLSPEHPEVVIDQNYILAAAGLLGTINSEAALRLMNRELFGSELN